MDRRRRDASLSFGTPAMGRAKANADAVPYEEPEDVYVRIRREVRKKMTSREERKRESAKNEGEENHEKKEGRR